MRSILFLQVLGNFENALSSVRSSHFFNEVWNISVRVGLNNLNDICAHNFSTRIVFGSELYQTYIILSNDVLAKDFFVFLNQVFVSSRTRNKIESIVDLSPVHRAYEGSWRNHGNIRHDSSVSAGMALLVVN